MNTKSLKRRGSPAGRSSSKKMMAAASGAQPSASATPPSHSSNPTPRPQTFLYPRRKTGQDTVITPGRQALALDLKLVSKYYHLPLGEAAKELGICLTSLKRVCRRLGLRKWPYTRGSMGKKVTPIIVTEPLAGKEGKEGEAAAASKKSQAKDSKRSRAQLAGAAHRRAPEPKPTPSRTQAPRKATARTWRHISEGLEVVKSEGMEVEGSESREAEEVAHSPLSDHLSSSETIDAEGAEGAERSESFMSTSPSSTEEEEEDFLCASELAAEPHGEPEWFESSEGLRGCASEFETDAGALTLPDSQHFDSFYTTTHSEMSSAQPQRQQPVQHGADAEGWRAKAQLRPVAPLQPQMMRYSAPQHPEMIAMAAQAGQPIMVGASGASGVQQVCQIPGHPVAVQTFMGPQEQFENGVALDANWLRGFVSGSFDSF